MKTTIRQALNINTKTLSDNCQENPHLDAELILSAVLKKSREFLLTHPERKLTPNQAKKFEMLIKKRLSGLPVAYLIGHKSFYGLDFLVNKNVLVPRPETEMMVDLITRNSQLVTHNARTTIVDVGTGSGCIIVSIVKQLQNISAQGGFALGGQFLATDVSPAALLIARKNAKQHGVNKHIKFLRGDLLLPVLSYKNFQSKIKNQKPEIIITANLPYLTPTQIKNSPSIKHEPKIALSAGPDGLKYYRQLFMQIRQMLNVKYQMSIFCEIDPSQSAKIKQLAKRELPKHKFEIKKDLAGYDRLAVIKINYNSI